MSCCVKRLGQIFLHCHCAEGGRRRVCVDWERFDSEQNVHLDGEELIC